MAAVPYILEGAVKKGPHEGYTDVNATIGTGGDTVNIFVSQGGEIAASQDVVITNNDTGNSITTTTDANGDYAVDLQNMTGGVSEGDSITIVVDTRTAIPVSEGVEVTHRAAKAYKVVQVDKRGTAHDEDYPFPIVEQTQLNGHPDMVGNFQTDFAYGSRTDGQPVSETVTLPNGDSWKRTFTYTTVGAIDVLSSRSRWVKQ